MYPARVLGDRELWPKLREELVAWIDSGENEVSLIPQWEACLLFDQRTRLPLRGDHDRLPRRHPEAIIDQQIRPPRDPFVRHASRSSP